MKQIIQNLKNGNTELFEIPSPTVKPGCVLIETKATLVSLGTEKMLVNFAQANYLSKARQQPEKVKEVLNKIKTDGIRPTLNAVFSKLDSPMALGYCNAGIVIGVGHGVTNFKIGDRVVSNGQHAEVVNVKENLVAKIPNEVTFDDAVFTVVGSIGLQGIRLINPTLGETIVVVGLGLIGLLTVQLLSANGCNVIGIDIDEEKLELARSFGIKCINPSIENSVKVVNSLTESHGSDGVIITASSPSNDILSNAAHMTRRKGRIVLVGVIGLNLNRADFYEKEISFQVSCSYGPGRYDSNYEEKGLDYPIGFVRWTENRNFKAILNILKNEKLIIKPLISSIIKLNEAPDFYDNIGTTKSIATIIKYSESESKFDTVVSVNREVDSVNGKIGIIGAGNFTGSMIVPKLKKIGANMHYIASSKGLSGTSLAKRYGIANSTTNYKDILKDNDVDSVVITTRHNDHASQVIEALEAGKHVFVEKPLALSLEELDIISNCRIKTKKTVTVGFNRRFSPFSIYAKDKLGNSNSPITVIATMNAGFIPNDHWVQDIKIGGGRIIGEACHYIDLISYFTGSKVVSLVANTQENHGQQSSDIVSILLRYENGSQGILNYLSNGSKSLPKERVTIYSKGENIVIDNFKSIQFYGSSVKTKKSSQDKGHENQFKNWNDMITKGGSEIINYDSILNTSKAAILVLESLNENKWIDVK